MKKVIKRAKNGATSHGFHMIFTCMEEKEENMIGMTVPSVRLGRKRLSTLSGAILAHSGSVWGQSKGKGCPRIRNKCGNSKIKRKTRKKSWKSCTLLPQNREQFCVCEKPILCV